MKTKNVPDGCHLLFNVNCNTSLFIWPYFDKDIRCINLHGHTQGFPREAESDRQIVCNRLLFMDKIYCFLKILMSG